MKTIKGDLILKEDTTFNESIKVLGDIKGDYDLNVIGNIDCRNINCEDIDCLDIDCEDIDCWNIILCDKIKVKEKCMAKKLIKDRFNIKRKEQLNTTDNHNKN